MRADLYAIALVLSVYLSGCSTTPAETQLPSVNSAASDYCDRYPGSVLCRK